MTTLREAAQQALEALERSETTVQYEGFGLARRDAERKQQAAIAALRAALAQEQAEPVAAERERIASQWDGCVTHQMDTFGPVDIGASIRAGALVGPAQQEEPDTCTWHQDGDSDSGVYATSCGHYFNLEDGTPEDNRMQWCCYCGKKLVQELITENDDE